MGQQITGVFKNGELHTKNGIIKCSKKYKDSFYEESTASFQNGRLHRTDGEPALIRMDGSRYWYKNGKAHRINGPSDELEPDSDNWENIWCQNGKRHREDGPAWSGMVNGEIKYMWYLNGIQCSPELFYTLTRSTPEEILKYIEIGIEKFLVPEHYSFLLKRLHPKSVKRKNRYQLALE